MDTADLLEEEEELDYDDDISVDEDNTSLIEGQAVKVSTQEQQQPGSSQQAEESLVNQLNSQMEEQLAQNPIIQCMMQKIFNEQFKNL